MGIFDSVKASMKKAVDEVLQNSSLSKNDFAQESTHQTGTPLLISVKSGSQIQLGVYSTYTDPKIESFLVGKPKKEDEEFSKTVKLVMFRNPSDRTKVFVKTLDDLEVGEIYRKDTELANKTLDAFESGLKRAGREYRESPLVFVVSARVVGTWIEYVDGEGTSTVEADIEDFAVKIKDPAQLELFEA